MAPGLLCKMTYSTFAAILANEDSMVWIHGGGYTLGSKVMYSPSAAGLLLESEANSSDGVVWVAMNYRLGAYVCFSLLIIYFRTLGPMFINLLPSLGISFWPNFLQEWWHAKRGSS